MDYRKAQLREEYVARLNRVLDYIDNHLDEGLSLDVLAGVAAFSPFHFHRVFYSVVGETVNEYVRRIRLESAANQLLFRPKKSITEIALDCGFSSSANFARDFKKHFGESASRYRAAHRPPRRADGEGEKSKIGKPIRNYGKDPAPPLGHTDRVFKQEGGKPPGRYEMEVEVKKLDAIRVAYVRHLGGYGPGIGEAFDKLMTWAAPRGLLSGARIIGISHDNPDVTPADRCRFDASLQVPDDVTGEGEVGIQVIPAGTHAVGRFSGPIAEIGTAYHFMFGDWMPGSGYQPADAPCYEIYYSNPDDDPRGSYDSDICIPVRPL